LADEEHVDVRRAAAGERARDPLEEPRRADVRPQVEPLPDREDQPPERDVVGDGRVADRPHQHGVVRAQGVERVGRHHLAVLAPVGGAPRELGPLERKPEGVDRPLGFRDHLRADPVAGEQRDAMSQTAAPTFPGTLSRYSIACSTATTSAYFAWMSNRFASCGAWARSATHSRGTIAGQPYWSRSIAVARMHPLVVAPQRTTESTPCDTRIEARVVPKNPDAPFLSTIGSSSRRSSRGSISTQRPPIWRSPRLGAFCSQRPPSFRLGSKPIVVKTTGSPFARATSSSRRVSSTASVMSEPSAHSGSVNPQLKSTTRTAGLAPSVTLLPRPAFA